MAIFVGGVQVFNSPFTMTEAQETNYVRGFVGTSSIINNPQSGSPLTTNSIYKILNSGDINWTSIGSSSTSSGTTFRYNGSFVTGSFGSCIFMRSNVYPTMVMYHAGRGAGAISSLNDGNQSGGRQLLPIYIGGNQVTIFRPGQIIRPVVRYSITTGSVAVSTVISSLGRGTNDIASKTATVVVQGGGGGGAGGNDSGGTAPFRGGGAGGAGGTLIIDVDVNDFATSGTVFVGTGGAGGAINQAAPGNAVSGTNSSMSTSVPSTRSITASGGTRGTHNTANPRLGVGGAGGSGAVNLSGFLNFSWHNITGGSGGGNGVAGDSRTGLTALTRSYIGNRIMTATFTDNSVRYNAYTSALGLISGAAATTTKSGGAVISHGTTTAQINERGGGGGASQYGAGGASGSTTTAGAGIRGSGGGGGRSADGFSAASRRAGGAGGTGFVMFFA
jgi:hypothetical protein